MKNYLQLCSNIFDCKVCPTRCDSVSKMKYNFENDADFSEFYEQKLMNYINSFTKFKAHKTTLKGYPDLEVVDQHGSSFYIEVKVQQRTFMSVEKHISQSGLKPSETIALNLSDLERYFELEKSKGLVIFIFWVLLNRPCIVSLHNEQYYYRLVSELKPIWEKEKEKRKFRRKSGEGDVVNGEHKGVTVNFHFTLNEMKVWDQKI